MASLIGPGRSDTGCRAGPPAAGDERSPLEALAPALALSLAFWAVVALLVAWVFLG